MKVIFDSEEEKTRFLTQMAAMFCPSDISVDLVDNSSCMSNVGQTFCYTCWERCGIKFEVKKGVDK